ncbi:hypothetical protein Fmac_028776 [Flemingia macrophylla]|uniref:Uncharacterized protein n=1 Tax=Flemingia macrophylla TaxID=520843 RepID=A0ABD1L8G2_9FABA
MNVEKIKEEQKKLDENAVVRLIKEQKNKNLEISTFKMELEAAKRSYEVQFSQLEEEAKCAKKEFAQKAQEHEHELKKLINKGNKHQVEPTEGNAQFKKCHIHRRLKSAVLSPGSASSVRQSPRLKFARRIEVLILKMLLLKRLASVQPLSSRLYDSISIFEYEQMKNLVSNLSAENKILKEQLQSYLELIRASQEESRLVREQTLATTQAILPPRPQTQSPMTQKQPTPTPTTTHPKQPPPPRTSSGMSQNYSLCFWTPS